MGDRAFDINATTSPGGQIPDAHRVQLQEAVGSVREYEFGEWDSSRARFRSNLRRGYPVKSRST
jgi:hypothetical protein